jgi:hypothetical protein
MGFDESTPYFAGQSQGATWLVQASEDRRISIHFVEINENLLFAGGQRSLSLVLAS